MRDCCLLMKIDAKVMHPVIAEVTSDFLHLSGFHFFLNNKSLIGGKKEKKSNIFSHAKHFVVLNFKLKALFQSIKKKWSPTSFAAQC